MIFIARDLVVCLAFFAVIYNALSCLVASAWWIMRRVRQEREAVNSADWLFGLRILPFLGSLLFTVFFTFPSFWLLERKSFDEDATTFLLAVIALILLGVGLRRALKAQSRTNHTIKQWLCDANADKVVTASATGAVATNAGKGAPSLMLVGLWRPKVMISDMAATVLSESELHVAIRHELEHQRSRDNLKKLIINAVPFPGMEGITGAWREASELAADDGAVRTHQDALDLATALIKLARPSQQWVEPELASGLVCGSSSVALRVRRLLEWRAAERRLARIWPWTIVVLFMVAWVATNYGTALALTHRLTERIVP